MLVFRLSLNLGLKFLILGSHELGPFIETFFFFLIELTIYFVLRWSSFHFIELGFKFCHFEFQVCDF